MLSDVFEALVAAIFLDTGGDLETTHKIIMKLVGPYLYCYGNIETVQIHPRTQTVDQWGKEKFANIKDHPIKVSHLNQPGANNTKIYKGFVGGIECMTKIY